MQSGEVTAAHQPEQDETAASTAEPTAATAPDTDPELETEPESPRPDARVSRVFLRRIDPWSVFKLSLVFYLTVCLVLLIAGSLLWLGAALAGVVENVERFVEDIGFKDFRFSPARILQAATVTGLTLVVGGTLGNTLLAVLYNLIGDVSGGLRLTLTEDVEPRRRKRKQAPG